MSNHVKLMLHVSINHTYEHKTWSSMQRMNQHRHNVPGHSWHAGINSGTNTLRNHRLRESTQTLTSASPQLLLSYTNLTDFACNSLANASTNIYKWYLQQFAIACEQEQHLCKDVEETNSLVIPKWANNSSTISHVDNECKSQFREDIWWSFFTYTNRANNRHCVSSGRLKSKQCRLILL